MKFTELLPGFNYEGIRSDVPLTLNSVSISISAPFSLLNTSLLCLESNIKGGITAYERIFLSSIA